MIGYKDFVFTTLLYPFGKDKKVKIDSSQARQIIDIKNWQILKNDRQESLRIDSLTTNATFILKNKSGFLVLNDLSLIEYCTGEKLNKNLRSIILKLVNGRWAVIQEFD